MDLAQVVGVDLSAGMLGFAKERRGARRNCQMEGDGHRHVFHCFAAAKTPKRGWFQFRFRVWWLLFSQAWRFLVVFFERRNDLTELALGIQLTQAWSGYHQICLRQTKAYLLALSERLALAIDLSAHVSNWQAYVIVGMCQADSIFLSRMPLANHLFRQTL